MRATLWTGLLLACAPAQAADTLTGAGSSAAALLYRAWGQAYARQHPVELQYEAIGSSAGLKKIRAGEVAFGASDVAPSEAELQRDQLVLVPTFVSGAVPVVNLPRVPRGRLRLSGELLADIYLGRVTRWNAPELQALNPGLNLPDLPIRPVGRSDGSGTTYYVSDYLSQVSPAWLRQHGRQTQIAWADTVSRAKGSQGVVQAVQDTPGTIGYVDYNYVVEQDLNPVQLRNAAGQFVAPSVAGFRAALRASDWVSKGDFHAPLTQRTGAASWPIAMGSFVLLPRVSSQSEATERALRFLMWTLLKGDTVVEGLSLVRLPDALQAQAFKALSSVSDRQGRALGAIAFSSMTR
ncbi:phosphate ABC transporter substrate-binding protein PstS [Curvibacter cyanobacteriorum]